MAKEIEINLAEENDVSMEVKDTGNVEIGMESDFGGTTDYSKLKNKPSINGVTLEGNKTLEELGIINYDDTEIKENITEIEKENTYQNKRLEYLEKNQIQAELKGEDTLTITDGAFAYANILKETEIEVEGEKKKAYIVGLPQGLSRQEQREGYNKLNLENEGKELSLEYTAEYNLKHENCKEQQTLKAGTYTLALKVKSLANGSINAISLKNVDTTVATFSGYTTTTTTEKLFIKTITVDTDVTFNRISIQNAQIGTYIIKEIMLLEGTYTAENLPAYEQYGTTPSIEYPSEIENIKAYNLFDKNAVINNKYIDVTGNENINDQWVITDYMEVDSNSNYTYFGIINVGVSPYSAFYDNNKTFISSFKQAIWKNVIKIPENAKYIRFSINKGAGNDLNTFIFYKGIEDKPYIPYGAINIKLENENLISDNINDWEEGHYNASTGFPEFYASRIRLIQLVKVKPNTTYYCNTYNNLYGFVIREYDYNKNLINNIGEVSNGTITTNSNTKYLSIALYKNTAPETTSKELFNLVENGTIKPFICLNNESNKDYVEHQEQNYNLHLGDLELNGLGDTRDSFIVELDNSYSYKKVKKLYLKKKFIIYNFNGTENWLMYYGESMFHVGPLPGPIYSTTIQDIALSNYYKFNAVKTSLASALKDGEFAMQNLYNALFCRENSIKTVDLWKTKLQELNTQGNPLKILYPLEKPELIDLTETYPELVQDIENIINNMFTYEEVTHINTPIGYMELTYTKSNKLIIKNYDNRISALEQAILSIGGQNV